MPPTAPPTARSADEAVHQRAFDGLPQVFGRYLLVQRMSRGGMGEIFLAKHGLAGFEKLAIIKKILPNLAADEQFISRFVDEAQVAIKLSHVNIAQVFEVGRVGDEYFLALEFVEGRDLRRTFAILQQRSQRLPVELALLVGRDIANGLAYAHRRTNADGTSLDLVHCDISPPNVLVSFEGETKIIDFGIARSALRATASDPAMGFGKFGYMAPEQLLRGGVIDHRTDIYAAGVVLYELITGLRLYESGPNPDFRALAKSVSRGDHPLPSHGDPSLAPFDALVARALRPAASERYQSAAELRDAIQTALVAVNPTVSADHLGGFMRELFADEMNSQKEMHERVANAQLLDFEAALHTQEVHTVSFAMSGAAAPSAVVGSAPASLVVAASATVALRGPMVPSAADSVVAPSEPEAGVRPHKTKPWLVVATIIALLLAAGLLLFVVMRDGSASSTLPDASTASFTPIATADAAPAADATPIDAAPEIVDARVRVEPRVDASTRPVIIDARPKTPVDAAAPTVAGATESEVKGKFSAVAREYRAFKAEYGGQLEAEWAELATFAQYAKANDWTVLDRRLDGFRRKLKAAKQ